MPVQWLCVVARGRSRSFSLPSPSTARAGHPRRRLRHPRPISAFRPTTAGVFKYNPRLLDIVQLIPRGTIYDRHGVPLATDDPRVIAAARPTYAQLGVSIDDRCPISGERCYPPGPGRASISWATRALVATGPPAIRRRLLERDADNSWLQGLRRSCRDRSHHRRCRPVDADDQARLPRHCRSAAAPLRSRQRGAGSISTAARRAPDDRCRSAAAGCWNRRGLRPEEYPAAAAVRAPPDSGELLLASVSYPWPETSASHESAAARFGASTRRACGRPTRTTPPNRYWTARGDGLYPPGSTFKLVTAAAALRQHLDPRRTVFTCARLPDPEGRRENQRLDPPGPRRRAGCASARNN